MWSITRSATTVIAATIAGCSYYPGFTAVENPDLYYIRSGDVIGGVKCAMYDFLFERQYLKGGDVGEFDKQRFELDPSQNATIQMTLAASTSGEISYTKIDVNAINNALGVNGKNAIIAAGSDSLPFPGVSITAKNTNNIDINLTMEQSVETSTPVHGVIKNGKTVAKYSDLDPDIPYFKKNQKFIDQCQNGDENGVRYDYLGLKKWLVHLLNDEQNSIWRGSPEVYLDNIVLTTQFDVQADLSFGLNKFLRLVPLKNNPLIEVKPDHSHQLKITLKGYKNTLPKSRVWVWQNGHWELPTSYEDVAKEQEKLRILCRRDTGGACTSPVELLLEKLSLANGK